MEPIQEENEWLEAKLARYVSKRSKWENKKIYKQGKRDAKRQQITSKDDHIIISNWATEQTAIANKKIENVWKKCDSDINPLQKRLEYIDYRIKVLNDELSTIMKAKGLIIDDIDSSNNPSDEGLSDATLASRKHRRKILETQNMTSKISDIKKEINELTREGKSLKGNKKNRQMIAMHHEEDINHDLKEIIGIYMQGTWKYLGWEIFEPKPPVTTKLPAERHMSNFPDNFSF